MATFKSLTTKERKHLKDNGCTTLTGFKVIAAEQKRMRDDSTSGMEPCNECKNIARKLGLPI